MRVAFLFPSIIVALFILSRCHNVSASEDRSCVTTCCKNCSGEPFCSLCRRLHSDLEGCKCVSDTEETLRSGHSGDRLSQLREPASDDIKTSEDQDVKDSKIIPKCRPSCCPRSDCTKMTCPSCYARMRRVPSLCPCVDIEETAETHLSQQQSNAILEDNISSVQNTLTDITNDDDNVTQVTTPRLVPLCRPSCCPRADCTKLSCSSCYARMRRAPDLCPCVNTGQFSERNY